MNEFITIKENVEVQIVEKKSKFIANLIYVENQEKAEEYINQFKKKYFDARHNCVAYRVSDGKQIVEKASDDGEPSGTAGSPMLNILQKNNLANVLVIVTRYFGGILLGTGGLVRAYSDSLLKAIGNSEFIQMCSGVELEVFLEYSEFEIFKHYCKNNDICIINVEYLEFIVCKIELELSKKVKFLHDFESKNILLKDIKELSIKYVSKSILK